MKITRSVDVCTSLYNWFVQHNIILCVRKWWKKSNFHSEIPFSTNAFEFNIRPVFNKFLRNVDSRRHLFSCRSPSFRRIRMTFVKKKKKSYSMTTNWRRCLVVVLRSYLDTVFIIIFCILSRHAAAHCVLSTRVVWCTLFVFSQLILLRVTYARDREISALFLSLYNLSTRLQ